MGKKFVSEEWKIGYFGHKNFDFIDIDLNKDNLLFLDPCLIENVNFTGINSIRNTMKSFFKEFYQAYYTNNLLLKKKILAYAKEENSTRLGYGNGKNGKGNTLKGLLKIFKPLESLVKDIKTIGTPQDTTIFVQGFAEDGLSDLITNVLHKELNDFTLRQMKKYGIAPNHKTSFYYWEPKSKQWERNYFPCYQKDGKKILLVPKQIVRKKYLYNVGHYFSKIVLEEVRKKENLKDLKGKYISKKEVEKRFKNENKHWKYDSIIDYTKRFPNELKEYHKNFSKYYSNNGEMTDEELDEMIYKN